jgi:2-polyprenyl-6-methoxyphenol hydroxylase-like FAD-dependent oxidoreductase
MSEQLQIAIVGGGIGGLTAALALRASHRLTVKTSLMIQAV